MNETLLDQVMSCDKLPTLPGVALQILQMAKDPDADIADMAHLISTDPALSGKILKTVNSSFYGLTSSVSTISQAIVVLGLQSVRSLALGFSLVNELSGRGKGGFDLMAYWRRSMYAAVAARIVGERVKLVQTEEAFLAALLQDIGMLAMHTALGERYGAIHASVGAHADLMASETEKLDLNHAQVGRAMAGRWSLPPLLISAIGCHHETEMVDGEAAKVTRVVHLAWRLAEVFLDGDAGAAVNEAKSIAESMFEIPDRKVEHIIEAVNTSAHEVAELFDVNIGGKVSTQRVLDDARDALVDLTLRSQKEATQLKSSNRKLQHAATTDPLTTLANRHRFEEVLGDEFSRAHKFLRNLSVVFIDADHFKGVNDTYGHAAGDEVLRKLGFIVRKACHGKGLAARYGGEEIVCILTEADVRTAAHLAESIRRAAEAEIVEHEGRTIRFSVSVGVAGMPNGMHFETAEALVDAADKAVYAAKKGGRNTVRISAIGTPAAKRR